MRDSKKKYESVMRCMMFFSVLAVLFFAVSVKTEGALLKNDRLVPVRNKNIYRIRREPANSIDVIVLGDSLSYSAISPMLLWKEHGFTTYVCGQSGQKILETENMLKTVLENQKPKLVILETDVMFRGLTGLKSINESIEELLNYYIPVFRGHDAWKSLVMDKEYADSVLQDSVTANKKIVDELKGVEKDMCQALLEIMEPEINQIKQEYAKEVTEEVTKKDVAITVKTLRDLGQSEDFIREIIIKNFELPPADADEILIS